MKHIYIVGAKGFQYGGYESFLDRLTIQHQNESTIKYHIACKANGIGCTDESKLDGVESLSESDYMYHGAHCFKVKVPNIGNAQAIVYDIKSLEYVCKHIKDNNISEPIVYILSSRIGFAYKRYADRIRSLGGVVYHNPDGLEFKREKYSCLVRRYWKWSEKLMVKSSDLEVCDSKNIEKYIRSEYKEYNPKTTYIAYGADIKPSMISDNDEIYTSWLKNKGLEGKEYYLSVGRFVPENNFETMIREFMNSDTTKKFAIVTTDNEEFLRKLDDKLHFSSDDRIRFVGTVYDVELLKKIRENAFAYIHGHSVGGTNPSLLESLASTKLNLLYDIGFNQEVAEDAALYWSLEDGNLAQLINRCDKMSEVEVDEKGFKAKKRIETAYSWAFISSEYLKLFTKEL